MPGWRVHFQRAADPSATCGETFHGFPKDTGSAGGPALCDASAARARGDWLVDKFPVRFIRISGARAG